MPVAVEPPKTRDDDEGNREHTPGATGETRCQETVKLSCGRRVWARWNGLFTLSAEICVLSVSSVRSRHSSCP